MYKIHVENIRTKSCHGCLKEESIIGGEYRTDVWIALKKEYLIKKDELSETVDYGVVTQIVVEEMKKNSKLIESVCERIVNRVIKLSITIQYVRARVCKINPPIDGDVENVSVEIKKEC
jgi:dihydroneopterin aldolase